MNIVRLRAIYRVVCTVAILMTSPGSLLACGPDFPMSLLLNRQHELEYAPEGTLAFELRLMAAIPELSSGTPNGSNVLHDTAEAEALDLSPQQATLIAEMRRTNSAQAALQMSQGLPKDVGLYTAGAVAWHQGEIAEAVTLFRSVSALPPQERRHRGIWAAFMEGRAQRLLKNPQSAVEAFERTRRDAASGSADPLKLATASLGEQARVLRESGDPVGALHFYLDQYAQGDEQALNSLRIVARDAVLDSKQFDALIQDTKGARLLIAYLFARSEQAENEILDSMQASDPDQSARERISSMIGKLLDLPSESTPAADRLSALAYRLGEYDKAEQWAERSYGPLASWVRAKLALRRGELDVAATLFAEAAAAFPAGEEAEGSLYFVGDGRHERPSCRVKAEAGTLALSRGEYVQALALFYESGDVHWTDAAYVAERVLTLDELKAFVARTASHVKIPTEADEFSFTDTHVSDTPARMRWLLARRMMREGHVREAIEYFDKANLKQLAEDYADRLENTGSTSAASAARNWFELARLTRWSGMELLGYEGDPDYAMYDGNFDAYPVNSEEIEGSDTSISEYRTDGSEIWGEDPADHDNLRADLPVSDTFSSDGEKERVLHSRAQPLERFHYRLVAANFASKAADLLPPRSQAFAAVLCEATGWLVNRNNYNAQLLYKRYVAEGPLGPWGENFGHACPEPDFGKVQREEYLQIAKDAAIPLLMVIVLSLAVTAAIRLRAARR